MFPLDASPKGDRVVLRSAGRGSADRHHRTATGRSAAQLPAGAIHYRSGQTADCSCRCARRSSGSSILVITFPDYIAQRERSLAKRVGPLTATPST